ncbi:MAG: riboflavin synthase [Gammaproteobacteria bacterium]
MFTGIVQDVGQVASRETRGVDARLVISTKNLDLSDTAVGDSISVQGVCLTVVSFTRDSFTADVSHETLSLTTLGELNPGSPVNLEPALRAGDRLGGHLVSGHVDGVAHVSATSHDGDSLRVSVTVPVGLARYIARKGSVTVDGVSLTVNEVENATFGVNLIPHTQAVTTLGRLQPGTRVNLEVDQMARYAERLLGAER